MLTCTEAFGEDVYDFLYRYEFIIQLMLSINVIIIKEPKIDAY